MKKVILSLVMLLMATSMFAQEKDVPNPAKVRVPSGYQGFIEQGNTWHFDKNMPNSISLSTTHGFYFNGHIYAGIGCRLQQRPRLGAFLHQSALSVQQHQGGEPYHQPASWFLCRRRFGRLWRPRLRRAFCLQARLCRQRYGGWYLLRQDQ